MFVKILDSRLVGVYYILISFLGSVLGFSFSIAIRLELSGPFCIFNEFFYYVNVTSHGLVMVFFFLTLLASGFSNYFLPHMCFQNDMALPRINVFSLWLILFSFIFIFLSLFLGEGVATGWTLYAPLSLKMFSDTISLELLITSIHLFSISSLLGSINILVTIFLSVPYFNSIFSYSPFIWSYISTSLLIILATPSLTCAVTMLLFDRIFNSYYFIYEFGGDPLLYQSMFWVWGHPEVYILILPVFGVVSQVIQSLCNILFNSIGIIFSMISLSVLSFLVWGHHMVTVGWGLDLKSYFMTSTMIISFPTSIKVFSWLFSLFMSKEDFKLPLCCFSLFLYFFSVGGLTGLYLSNSILDNMFHDGYFVVGHFHFVLANASILGFLSGLFFFFFNFFNTNYIIKYFICFISSFSFFLVLTFTPFHSLGYLGLPRRICSYPFEEFLLFYLCNISFLGVWFNYLFFLFIFLSSIININNKIIK